LHPAPVRGHLLPVARLVAVRTGRAAGQLLPPAAAPARLGRRQRELPPRPPPERQDPELQPPRCTREPPDVPTYTDRHAAQQHPDVPAEALGYRKRVPGPILRPQRPVEGSRRA